MMKRTQVQLDEATYELTRQKAFAEGRSVSAVIREAVGQYLASPASRGLTMSDFSFIESGRSGPGDPRPLSERHDDALAEDFAG